MQTKALKRIFLFLLLVLIVCLCSLTSCCRKVVSTTSTTTTLAIDTVITIPAQIASFYSLLPDNYDTIVLTDPQTGFQLSIHQILDFNTQIVPNSITPIFPKPLTVQSLVEQPNVTYGFTVVKPLQQIPVTANQTTTHTETITAPQKVPWYYRISVKLWFFAFGLLLIFYVVKKVIL